MIFRVFTAAMASVAFCLGANAVPVKLDSGRCPVKPPPQLDYRSLPNGEFLLTARFLLKADGSIEQIKVEGKGPESFRRAVAAAVLRYECLPAEADQEIASEFRISIS